MAKSGSYHRLALDIRGPPKVQNALFENFDIDLTADASRLRDPSSSSEDVKIVKDGMTLLLYARHCGISIL
jgi:hypothetical protein